MLGMALIKPIINTSGIICILGPHDIFYFSASPWPHKKSYDIIPKFNHDAKLYITHSYILDVYLNNSASHVIFQNNTFYSDSHVDNYWQNKIKINACVI